MQTIELCLCLGVLIVAVIWDLRKLRVPNFLVFGGLTGLLVIRLIGRNPVMLLSFFQGMLLPVIILFILFIFGMLGAGDIKLFALIGASIGPENILYVMVFSFVFGAVISLITMIKRKNFIARIQYFFNWIICCVRVNSAVSYGSLDEKSDGVIAFSISILLGFITYWGWTYVKINSMYM